MKSPIAFSSWTRGRSSKAPPRSTCSAIRVRVEPGNFCHGFCIRCRLGPNARNGVLAGTRLYRETLTGMELRRLSYLVSACQERSFGAAADQLGIRQSTLSGAMKTLAEEFGVPLFEQMQRRVHPTLAGIWLYRSALLLLHAEEFARNWIGQGPDDGSTAHLIVDIRASFVLGQLGKSVGRAIQRFTRDHPNIF